MPLKTCIVSTVAFVIILTVEYVLADKPVVKINNKGSSVKSIQVAAGEMLHLTCELPGKTPPDFSCTANDIYNQFITSNTTAAVRHVIVNNKVNDTGKTYTCSCVDSADSSNNVDVAVEVGKPLLPAASSSANAHSNTVARELSAGVTVLLLIGVLMISVVPISWFIYKSGKSENLGVENELCNRAFSQSAETVTV